MDQKLKQRAAEMNRENKAETLLRQGQLTALIWGAMVAFSGSLELPCFWPLLFASWIVALGAVVAFAAFLIYVIFEIISLYIPIK